MDIVKDGALIAESVVTIIAVGVGGWWALYRRKLFRELKGYLEVRQSVSRVRLADEMIHVQVAATIYNHSKVWVPSTKGFCIIEGLREGVAPESIREIAKEKAGNPLEQVAYREMDDDIALEPGEELLHGFDFVIEGRYAYLRSRVFVNDPWKDTDVKWGPGWESIELIEL